MYKSLREVCLSELVRRPVPFVRNYRAQAAELSGEKAESRLRVTAGPGGCGLGGSSTWSPGRAFNWASARGPRRAGNGRGVGLLGDTLACTLPIRESMLNPFLLPPAVALALSVGLEATLTGTGLHGKGDCCCCCCWEVRRFRPKGPSERRAKSAGGKSGTAGGMGDR